MSRQQRPKHPSAGGQAARKSSTRRLFRAADGVWGGLEGTATAALVSSAADLSLVISSDGMIDDVAVSKVELPVAVCSGWIGKRWSDIVAPESAGKLTDLAADARTVDGRPWRHVNHLLPDGGELPIQYRSATLDGTGRIVAFGRDMRDVAQLQQRLLDAQQVVERDYWRLRNVETRYRMLFDRAVDGLVIVDASGNNKVLEANEAAAQILGMPLKRLLGQSFPAGLPDRSRRELDGLMSRVRSGGRAEDFMLNGGRERRPLKAIVSPFATDDQAQLLVRLQTLHGAAEEAAGSRHRLVTRSMDHLPDAVVVTDAAGRIVAANPAFVGFVQFNAEDQVRGQSLGRWLGRTSVDLNVMLATIREQGALRLFSTLLRGEFGAELEVEISGSSADDSDGANNVAFLIRHVGRRLASDAQASSPAAPRSVEQLTQLVGRRPLKELVRESTDLIEQLCIEAALQLTQDNRASAAEMLGLSRQSLYVKLRRYGMAERGADGAD